MAPLKQAFRHPWADRVAAAAKRLESSLRPKTRIAPEDTQCLLVLQHRPPLGSCVHMTPVYEAIKQMRPGITLVVVTRGLGLQVPRHSPFIDHLLETPDPATDLRGAIRSLKQQLRERGLQPDGCVTGVGDQRTRTALLAAAVCTGWRGGFSQTSSLYHHPLTTEREISLIANNLKLAKLVGAETDVLEPRVFFSEEDIEAAATLLAPLRSRANQPVLVAVTQTSRAQATDWHDDRWVEVLRHAWDDLGYEIAFVGTAGEAEAIEELRAKAGGIGLSLAGKTSVPVLAAVLANSDLAVSVDTGTMHVARTTGLPMVVLGPSWQKPHEWLPLGKEHVVILRGEDRDGVPAGYRLDEIAASDVCEAIDRLTELYPASFIEREARVKHSLSTVDLLGR